MIAQLIDKFKAPMTKSQVQELLDEHQISAQLQLSEYTLEDFKDLMKTQQNEVIFSNDELISFRNEAQSYQIASELSSLIRDRIDAKFGFDARENSTRIQKYSDKFYTSRDIFDYLYNCEYNQLKKQKLPEPLLYMTNVAPFDGIFSLKDYEASLKTCQGYQMYVSPFIDKQLEKCGWNTGQTNGTSQPFNIQYSFNLQFCDRLDSQQLYMRSAAIAIVHCDFERGLKSLNKIQQTPALNQLKAAIMSICLNQKDKKYDHFTKMNVQISGHFLKACHFTDPYTLLIQQFIMKDQFIEYLMGPLHGISVFDRVGLYFRFLSHSNLQVIENQLPEGLDRIVLKGRCAQSVEVLQQYLDLTGDIQLCGTIAGHFYYLDFPQPQRMTQMYYAYLEHLEQLSQFEVRAKILVETQQLEQLIGKNLLIQDKIGKIALGCLYCRKSLGQASLENARKSNPKRNNEVPKPNSCPMCLYLLPKCVICVNHFQLPTPEQPMRRGAPATKPKDSIQLSDAMVWCLSCKHGGHEAHLEDWFRLFTKCPVEDCGCQCNDIQFNS